MEKTTPQNTGIDLSQTTKVVFDSREATTGALFVAIPGTQIDGHKFIETAIQNGATTIVCQKMPETIHPNVTYHTVADPHQTLAELACEFYENPSQQIKVIGITGTNGKTTTATLLFDLMTQMGYHCGLLSTVENRIGQTTIPATHTTPNPVELNRLLREMVDGGCEFCFMEVSSHAVVQRRTETIEFTAGVFTNLTHDHLDYHGTFLEYRNAKKRFFDNLPKTAFALTNADDKNGEIMLQNTKAQKYTYALQNPADFTAKIIETHLNGMQLRVQQKDIYTKFIGRFNAYNITAIYTTATLLLGEEMQDEILTAISQLEPVNGRFATINRSDGALAVVDYAHTPDALQNVLQTIQEVLPPSSSARIITVVGCGGDRDCEKRPIMAKIAAQNSHQTIITSDNPRTENPDTIIQEMIAGLTPQQLAQTLTIENRAAAIKTACTLATKNDIILVAGKGHETYQEINGTKHHFSDTEEIKKAFNSIP